MQIRGSARYRDALAPLGAPLSHTSIVPLRDPKGTFGKAVAKERRAKPGDLPYANVY